MANYTDTLLASGERIIRRAHQHWFVFIANARFAVIAVLVAIGLFIVRSAFNLSGTIVDVLGAITLLLFAFGVLSLVWSVLRFRNEEYLITNRRLMHAEGVINKKTTDSSLEKITDAVLTESVFGRMFGFGDLDVLTASEEGVERLRMLRDAKSFKKAMIEAKHELELELTRPTMPPLRSEPAPVAVPAAPVAAAPAPPPPAATAPAVEKDMSTRTDEVADALDRLGELRDKGLITPEEFDAKKRQLLERL
ncbi:MAG: PH domain-containing protein [Candidatus Limnocylindrales bacterium]